MSEIRDLTARIQTIEQNPLSMLLSTAPVELKGPWQIGWALDLHTVSSKHIGVDELERRYDTQWTEVGGALNRLKYREDRSGLQALAETAAAFIREHKHLSRAEIIVSVPPSNRDRNHQPLPAVAAEVARRLRIPYYEHGLRKTKDTPELKQIKNFQERTTIFRNAFKADTEVVEGKEVLLFDDVCESGATLSSAAVELRENGRSKYVFVLTLTKTRK